MKKRVSVFLNFIAFNLLFFALYLNFIHKDAVASPAITQQMHSSIEASLPGQSLESVGTKESVSPAGEKTIVAAKEEGVSKAAMY